MERTETVQTPSRVDKKVTRKNPTRDHGTLVAMRVTDDKTENLESGSLVYIGGNYFPTWNDFKPSTEIDLTNYKTPTPWRDVTNSIKPFAYQQVFKDLQPEQKAYAFTLNLSPDWIDKANDNPKAFTNNLYRAVCRHLKRSLGRLPDFYFVIESRNENNAFRPHVHGTISLNDSELRNAREALKGAGGEWAAVQGENKQLVLKPVHDHDGWADYLRKAVALSKHDLKSAKNVFVSQSVTRRAKAIWESKRRNILSTKP